MGVGEVGVVEPGSKKTVTCCRANDDRDGMCGLLF